MPVDLVAAESRRFFHVHLQKTGGTTLALQLRRRFGEHASYPNPTDGDLASDAPALSPKRLRARWADRGSEIRFVSGHFPLGTTELLDADFTTLTVLRDPVERTLSLLRNLRERSAATRPRSLEAIYADEFVFRSMIQNHMVKMFCLAPGEVGRGMFARVDFSRAHLERAEEQLSTVDVIGLLERFPDFCHELDRRFAWQTNESVHANRTQPVEVSPALRDRIAADNAFDVELYEFACGLVEERASGDQPAFHDVRELSGLRAG